MMLRRRKRPEFVSAEERIISANFANRIVHNKSLLTVLLNAKHGAWLTSSFFFYMGKPDIWHML